LIDEDQDIVGAVHRRPGGAVEHARVIALQPKFFLPIGKFERTVALSPA
jgi:hypothetical protein